MATLLSTLTAASELLTLVCDLALLLLGVRLASALLDALRSIYRVLTALAELTLLLTALALSVTTDAALWLAPRAGRVAGRVYRLCRHHWPTVRRGLEAVRLTVARFVWTQAGHSPAPVPEQSLTVRPVVAKALPGIVPSLNRRQLLSVAQAVQLPRYSRLSTDHLRAALATL